MNDKYSYNNNILPLHSVKQKNIYKVKFRLLIFFKMRKDNIRVVRGKI